MYPREFFDTYWRGDLRAEVFVAMPFKDFDDVWTDSIKPAIEEDLGEGPARFKAHRVDTTTISSSIHFEILDGIAHATLVFVDISITREGDWKGQRNGNVMFELGIAQTVRPATDLIVVRSDKEKIAFDTSHIHINSYERDDLAEARRKFVSYLQGGLRERNLHKSLRTAFLRDRLDVDSMRLMVKAVKENNGGFNPFIVTNYSADERRTAARLLDLGIIRCVCPTGNSYRYEWTDFGKHCYNNPNTT